jgi:hypothetical protein
MANIKLNQGMRFFKEVIKETEVIRREIARLRQHIELEEVAAFHGNPNPRNLLIIINLIEIQQTRLQFILVNAGRIGNSSERLLYSNNRF